MSSIIKAPRGTFDVMPEDMPLWYRLENAARDAFARYGYSEIRTPLIEDTRLFIRGIGDTTDIVEKEIFSVTSSRNLTGGRSSAASSADLAEERQPAAASSEDALGLRPEGTAGVVRAYIEHGYPKTAPMQKFCYIGPMFRYERPQAGRQRQFNQIGVEVLGTYAPEADVETIVLALDIFSKIALSGVRLKLNSIGCPICRPAYREAVRAFMGGRVEKLCGDCKRRYDRNIFRVLDCKQEGCRALTADVPEIDGYLCPACKAHFGRVNGLLAVLGIAYTKDKYLVRGFDYYTHTLYEIAHPALGARDAVCGGGRYDNLVAELGGPATGAVGFAIGMEAALLAMKNTGSAQNVRRSSTDVSVVVVSNTRPEDSKDREAAFKVLQDIRRAGMAAEMSFKQTLRATHTVTDDDTAKMEYGASLEFEAPATVADKYLMLSSVNSQMREANKKSAKVVVLVSAEKVAAGEITLRDMRTHEQRSVPLSGLVGAVRDILDGNRGAG